VELVSSVIRLELRPAEWVLWKARPFRFVSLHGSTASIRDLGHPKTVPGELIDYGPPPTRAGPWRSNVSPSWRAILALTHHDIERMTRNSTLIISQSN
jgi:hypothetical protein